MAMRGASRGDLDEALQRSVKATAIAEGNWFSIGNGNTPSAQTTTNPGNVIIMAILLQPRLTGFFHVDVSVSYSSGTNGITNTWELITDTVAGGVITAGSATKSAVGYAGSGALVHDGEALSGSAAGTAVNGLLYNGAPWTTSPTVQKVSAIPTLTGLLAGGAQSFEAHGIVGQSGTAKVPFLLANTVAFGIALSGGGSNVITIESLNFTVQEIPFA
jgi:hypothetical protein